MKRFVATLLLLSMLLSLCACAGQSLPTQTETETIPATTQTQQTLPTEEETTAEEIPTTEEPSQTETKDESAPVPIPNPVPSPSPTPTPIPTPTPTRFQAGFARVDITPKSFPVYMNSSTKATEAKDPLYATCVALSDGTETVFLVHTDLKRTTVDLHERVSLLVNDSLSVPSDHILITATHTHNAPEVNRIPTDSAIGVWATSILYVQLKKVILDAYADLQDATAYGGTADTRGFAFVRRYICADGSLTGIQMSYPTGSPKVSHETDADPELQVLKLKRSGRKDILMVNWQAHVAHAASTYKNGLTADFVGVLRKGVESKMNVDFAYYNGASGNLNLSTSFSNLRANAVKNAAGSAIWQQVGNALVDKVKQAADSAVKLKTGAIRVAGVAQKLTVRTDDATRLAQAKEINAASGTTKTNLMKQYGFQSNYEVTYMISRSKAAGKQESVFLGALSCGEIGFVFASYEMFDTNGMQIKDAAGQKMTFVCSCTNGSNGYFPAEDCYDRGGYEVHVARYEKGSSEICVATLLSLLGQGA